MAIAILPDGSKREMPDGSTLMQVAESIGKGLAKAAIVARVDDKLVDLSSKLPPPLISVPLSNSNYGDNVPA